MHSSDELGELCPLYYYCYYYYYYYYFWLSSRIPVGTKNITKRDSLQKYRFAMDLLVVNVLWNEPVIPICSAMDSC